MRRSGSGISTSLSSSIARSRASRGDIALVAAQHLGDLEPDRVHRVERRHRLLEDHRHARGRASSAARAASRPTISVVADEDRPVHGGVVRQQTHHRQRDRRLARARLADDRHRLAGAQVERHRLTAGYQVPSTQKSTSRSRTETTVSASTRSAAGVLTSDSRSPTVAPALPALARWRHDRDGPAVVRPPADRRDRVDLRGDGGDRRGAGRLGRRRADAAVGACSSAGRAGRRSGGRASRCPTPACGWST